MTMYLRRAITLRSSMQLLRGSTIQSRNVSHILFNQNFEACNTQKATAFPAFDFLRDSRRGFAKGKKSKNECGGGKVEYFFERSPFMEFLCATEMDDATVASSKELMKLRTGGASPGMLDHITVEIKDMNMNNIKINLNHLADVSVIDSKTLLINPCYPEKIKEMEKAIVSSPLGLNPKMHGDRLIAAIQPLTKEDVQATRKEVSKCCKDAKQSIRRARRKALDGIKKHRSITDDSKRYLEKKIEMLFKEHVKLAEDMCKGRGKEITQAWAEERCKAKKKEITQG